MGPVQQQLDDVAQRRQRLLRALADGLDEDEYERRRRLLDKEESDLQARAAGKEEALARLTVVERDLAEIKAALDSGLFKMQVEVVGNDLRQVLFTAHQDGTPVEPEPERVGGAVDDGFSDWAVTWSEADPDDVTVTRRFSQVTALRQLLRGLKARFTVYPDGHVEAEGSLLGVDQYRLLKYCQTSRETVWPSGMSAYL